MFFCYVDESGDTGTVASATDLTQPVLVLAGVVLPYDAVPGITRDFIALKRQFFPGKFGQLDPFLDGIAVEVKGADVRREVRSSSRRERRRTRTVHTWADILPKRSNTQVE